MMKLDNVVEPTEMSCVICHKPCTTAYIGDVRLCRWDLVSVLRMEWHDIQPLGESLLSPNKTLPEMRHRVDLVGEHCYACNNVKGLQKFKLRTKGFNMVLMACEEHHCVQEHNSDRKDAAFDHLPDVLLENLLEEEEEKSRGFAGTMADLFSLVGENTNDENTKQLAEDLRARSNGTENNSLDRVETIRCRIANA